MLNNQPNEKGILKSFKNYPEFVLYIGIAICLLIEAGLFLFNDYLYGFSSVVGETIFFYVPIIILPLSAILFMIILSFKQKIVDLKLMVIPWIIGLSLATFGVLNFREAYLFWKSDFLIFLSLGTTLLYLTPWISFKVDFKLRIIGLLCSIEPFLVFIIYFNTVERPLGYDSYGLLGTLFVLSAIVAICLAFLAWHVRKKLGNQPIETPGESDVGPE